jgi:excisionase family DNA binding protein
VTGSHDETSDPAALSASAAKWRERARTVELAGHRCARARPTNVAARLATPETGREDQQLAFYSVDEVAERLNLCSKTIRNWIRDGRLPAHRLGKKLAIAKSELTAFIAQCRIPYRK